jgi:hypothetical protein
MRDRMSEKKGELATLTSTAFELALSESWVSVRLKTVSRQSLTRVMIGSDQHPNVGANHALRFPHRGRTRKTHAE